MLTPARKIRLSEEVVGAIKDAIRRGAIQPGQRLVETDIAAQMRVSKAPVREALRQLQAEGLVENYPQRGSFVVGLSDQDMWEIATLRSELEGMALELAAQRIDAEGLQQMEDLLQEMVGAEDSGLRTERHLEFHYVPIRYCGHKRLQGMLDSLRSQTHTFSTFSQLLLYGTTEEDAQEHRYILDVLRQGDAKLARQIIAEHVMPERYRGHPSTRVQGNGQAG